VVPYAIPTLYAGVRFRSRLEARWAAFFNLVGWRWEYEPLDLRGWIPDFALLGASATIMTLVEVKPVASISENAAQQACEKAARAVLDSGRYTEILLLGHTWPETVTAGVGLGWLAEWYMYDDDYPDAHPNWAVAAFHDLGGLGFHHEEGTWRNRITGEYDGDNGAFADAPAHEWVQAGNITQWRGAL